MKNGWGLGVVMNFRGNLRGGGWFGWFCNRCHDGVYFDFFFNVMKIGDWFKNVSIWNLDWYTLLIEYIVILIRAKMICCWRNVIEGDCHGETKWNCCIRHLWLRCGTKILYDRNRNPCKHPGYTKHLSSQSCNLCCWLSQMPALNVQLEGSLEIRYVRQWRFMLPKQLTKSSLLCRGPKIGSIRCQNHDVG